MTDEERRRKERERRAVTRAMYIAVFGSTRLLRGPERRKYNSKRRGVKLENLQSAKDQRL